MTKAEQYLSDSELATLGLAAFGRNVFVSRQATITHLFLVSTYGPDLRL